MSTKIKEVIDALCEERAKKDDNIVSERAKEYLQEINIRKNKNKKEEKDKIYEEAKRRAIKEWKKIYRKGYENIIIDGNFGLDKREFNLENYEKEEIINLWHLYEYLRDLENPVLVRNRYNGKEQSSPRPNEKLMYNVSNGKIHYRYEDFYEEIIKKGREKDKRLQHIGDKMQILRFFQDGIHLIVENINDAFLKPNNRCMWSTVRYRIDDFEHCGMQTISKMIKNNGIVDLYFGFFISELLFETLLTFSNVLCEKNRDHIEFLKYYLDSIEKIRTEDLECTLMEYQIKGRIEHSIFQDYAILYYVNAIEKENEKIIQCFDYLYDTMPNESGEKFDLDRLDKVKKSGRDARKKGMDDFMKDLSKRMEHEFNYEEDTILKAIDREIYVEKEIPIDFEKGTNSKMIAIWNKYHKGLYNKPNIGGNDIDNERGLEIPIMEEKIRRGCDCIQIGVEYARVRNRIQRCIYKMRKDIYSRRMRDLDFVVTNIGCYMKISKLINEIIYCNNF